MSKRIIFAVYSVAFLFAGALIYVLFRKNSYVAIFADSIIPLNKLWLKLEVFSCNFIKFYLPDFLWSFSLCFGLYAVFLPSIRGSIICSAVVFLYGTIWELLQYLSLVGGTGDVLDIMMYLAAGLIAAYISFKKEKSK